MTYDVGDTTTLTLTVDPFDDDTAATVAVTSPTGVESAPTATAGDDNGSWSATLALDEAGEWTVVWTVTGTGTGEETQALLVGPSGPGSFGTSYATTADLAAWLGTAPPAGAGRTLVRASAVISRATMLAVYSVDDDGAATDTAVTTALRAATCAQAEYWQATNTDHTGASAVAGGAQIGSVRIDGGTAGSGGAAVPLSPAAADILAAAGLLAAAPYIV